MINPEEELVKNIYINLRDPGAKLRQLDGIKSKPTMTLSEKTDCLQFRTQAAAFESSSTGNKPVTVKEAAGYKFKKTFRKPKEKFSGSEGNGHLCNRCDGRPHSRKLCVQDTGFEKEIKRV